MAVIIATAATLVMRSCRGTMTVIRVTAAGWLCDLCRDIAFAVPLITAGLVADHSLMFMAVSK